MSPVEQLDLLELIWTALSNNPESLPLSLEHRVELDTRLDALERSPGRGRPWSEVSAIG